MKSHPLILLSAVLACHGPAAAQTGSPRAQEPQPRERGTSVVHDGIVFYRGQTYLIRNSRAALVDATLVPEGQVLTAEGRLVTLPTDFVYDATPKVREGLFAIRGQAYLIRNGRMMPVDAALVPEGQVLTAEGRRVPLPSDFSGFVLDRAPDGTVLPAPPSQAGLQTLTGQAGVPQAPSLISQGGEQRPMPPSQEIRRVVAAPVGVKVRAVLPMPPSQAGLQTFTRQAGGPQAPSLFPQGMERSPMPPSQDAPRVVEVRAALPTPINLLPPAVPITKTP
ncbi:MAG TPA: hypothetical protein DDZ88_19825 [Verrucomicrobiales bacterium]|nr:hypothetical protein [Verrucomicrobiales bacterium]